MPRITVTEQVQAPPEVVFALATDFAGAPGRIKGITKMEVLTPAPVGIGTRFRETRVMFGKEATEEMTVTAFEPPHRVEHMANSCGAEYRSVFRFMAVEGGTRMDVEFNVRAVS